MAGVELRWADADGTLPDVAAPVRFAVDCGGTRFALHVFDIGLACCAVEFAAAATALAAPADDAAPSSTPVAVDVVVVSGTVTDKLAPAVLRLWEALPEPKHVLSFGACASSGGPYWDSYSVTKGVDQLLPVDVYVPGCPPRPEALLQGLAVLQSRLAAGPAGSAGPVGP
jgi:NADH-quinone oxidoreductase subunit B